MIYKKPTSLLDFLEIASNAKSAGHRFANLHEVLNFLENLDMQVKAESIWKYDSVHLVASATLEDPGRCAIVEYSNTGNISDSDCFTVKFIQSESIDWDSVKKDDNWFFWIIN